MMVFYSIRSFLLPLWESRTGIHIRLCWFFLHFSSQWQFCLCHLAIKCPFDNCPESQYIFFSQPSCEISHFSQELNSPLLYYCEVSSLLSQGLGFPFKVLYCSAFSLLSVPHQLNRFSHFGDLTCPSSHGFHPRLQKC